MPQTPTDPIKRMHDYHFYNVQPGLLGTVESCAISGHNLHSALKDKVLAPCGLLMISMEEVGQDMITGCKPLDFFNVQELAFSYPESQDPAQRCTLSPEFIDWLKKLPKKIQTIAFNKDGFNAQQLAKLKADPVIGQKIFIATPGQDSPGPTNVI